MNQQPSKMDMEGENDRKTHSPLCSRTVLRRRRMSTVGGEDETQELQKNKYYFKVFFYINYDNCTYN